MVCMFPDEFRHSRSSKGFSMPAKNGDTLLVHYTGTLDDGTVFDSSTGGEPLEATLGEGMLIPGFENALIGMSAGEKKTVTIPPEDAYGEHLDELVFPMPRADVPSHVRPEPGMLVQLAMENDEEFDAVVIDVDDETVTLDANHPLGGETLTFELEIVAVK